MKKSLLSLALSLVFIVSGCTTSKARTLGDLVNDPKYETEASFDNPQYVSEKDRPEEGDVIDIYSLNDTHGTVEFNQSNKEPGLAKLSAYIDSQRKLNKDGSLLISAGDMFQGSMESNLTQGNIMIDWMKMMKFDAMAIGNHEFDWGINALKENINKLTDNSDNKWSVPVLNANIHDGNYYRTLGVTSTTFIKNGAKIGIIGSTAITCEKDIDSEILGKYKIESPLDIVKNEATWLRNSGADLIIYVTHGPAGTVNKKLAGYVDAAICGHSHETQVETKTNDGYELPCIQSSFNGQLLGHLSFRFTNDKFRLEDMSNSEYIADMDITPSQEVETLYQNYLDTNVTDGNVTGTIRSLKNDRVGSVLRPTGSDAKLSMAEVCGVFVRAQFSEYQHLGIKGSYYNKARTEWNVGDITYEDIYRAFPFDNQTVIVEVKGSDLSSWSSLSNYVDGSVDPNEAYKIVACSFILNNSNVLYNKVITTYADVQQRHVLYSAFLHAENNTLYTLS